MKNKLILLLIILCLRTFSQIPTVCFNGITSSNEPTVASYPHSICTADFNNDGNLDAAVANDNTNKVSILMGQGTGSFVLTNTYTIQYFPYSIVAGDFNNDGKIDLATANDGSGVTLMFGNGFGGFSGFTNYTVGTYPNFIISKDFNIDGNLDLAVSNGISNNVSILIGSGTGTFAPAVNYSVGSNPEGIISDDFNGDGFLDLTTANYTSNDISILIGSATGTFAAAINYSVGTNPDYITSGDFNNDGKIDLVASNYTSNNLSLLFGYGNGSFTTTTIPGTFNQPYCVHSKDIDLDGKLDLLVENHYRGLLSVLKGNGTGSFAMPLNFPVGMQPSEMAIADYNNDGRLDVVTANYSSNNITILLGLGNCYFASSQSCQLPSQYPNQPSSLASGDYNNDGKEDFAVAYQNGPGILSVFMGNGNGTFSSSNYTNNIATGSFGGLINEDFNGDGILDLAYGSSYPSLGVSVCFGLGLGTFSTPISYTNVLGNGITSADFNNDGNKDIAVTRYANNDVFTLLGSPSGSFLAGSSYSVGPGPSSICNGDFNGDGIVDLAIANTDISSTYFSVLFGLGPGTFSSAVNYTIGTLQESICSGNFNNDAYADLAIADGVNVYIFLGSPGNLVQGMTYAGGSPVSTGDYNGDGNADLAIANGGNSKITIMSGNGTGLFFSPKTYRTNFLQVSLVSNDFNSDGKADIAVVTSENDVDILMSGNINVSSSSNSICIGNSVTLIGSAAVNYSWNVGPTTNSIVVSPTTTTSYTVTGVTLNGCNYSAVKTVSVHPLPTLTTSPNTSVCIGTSANLSVTTTDTFTWSTNSSSTTINVQPTLTTTYSVTATSTFGCIKTETINVLVDPTCQNVWPGDANSDGVANNLDILELGLHFMSSGPPRSIISNSWTAYYANNWIGLITGGKNLNNSDCNGDGLIDLNDTLAVFNNYNLLHAFRQMNIQSIANTDILLSPDQPSLAAGNWGTSSIYLGDTSNIMNNINGVAFTVNFDNALIEQDSIWIEFPVSFLNVSSNNLNFRKRDFGNGLIYAASTHTNNLNVTGYGKIGILHYKIQVGVNNNSTLHINVSQGIKSNNAGVLNPLTSGYDTVNIVGAAAGLISRSKSSLLSFYPNPTKGIVIIKSSINLKEIEVYNSSGQLLIMEIPDTTDYKLNVNNLSNGIYFVKLTNEQFDSEYQKLILQK